MLIGLGHLGTEWAALQLNMEGHPWTTCHSPNATGRQAEDTRTNEREEAEQTTMDEVEIPLSMERGGGDAAQPWWRLSTASVVNYST